jgi:predicted nucleic-acid-binding Zn-ribbon protein
MTDTLDTSAADRLAELVKKSFPDLRCLRCRNDKFYVTDDPATANLREVRTLLGMPAVSGEPFGPVVTLACRRCGYIEQHLTDLLLEAPQPVPLG